MSGCTWVCGIGEWVAVIAFCTLALIALVVVIGGLVN